MDFLSELKVRAQRMQSQKAEVLQGLSERIAQTEAACALVEGYFRELARSLNVIEPAGPAYSLDGKTPWPAMKLRAFQPDARKKQWHGKEAYDVVSLGWSITPQMGMVVGGAVTVQFIPDVPRIQQVLRSAYVEHQRKEQYHPQRNTLQAVTFEYTTEARAHVSVKPDHDTAQLAFNLSHATGFGTTTITVPAGNISYASLDELAKLLLAQPSTFA